MKKIFKTISVFMLCAVLVAPIANADNDNRRGAGGRRERTSQSHTNRQPQKSDNSGSRGGVQHNQPKRDKDVQRPANSRPQLNENQSRPNNNGNVSRPSNNGNNNRPSNNGTTYPGQRPPLNSNQGSGNHRPNQNARPEPATRPQMPQRPSAGGPHYPNYRPGHQVAVPPPPPSRPYRPTMRPINRPIPPAAFRPRYHLSPLEAILGFGFGTALNISLNVLTNMNYAIDGYANNRVYLRDVDAMNYRWPDATLLYKNGLLESSVFSYSTSYNNPARYNNLYINLSRMYGSPVSVMNNGNSLSATWFGYNNQYITIEYQPQFYANGGFRFFTNLILGN